MNSLRSCSGYTLFILGTVSLVIGLILIHAYPGFIVSSTYSAKADVREAAEAAAVAPTPAPAPPPVCQTCTDTTCNYISPPDDPSAGADCSTWSDCIRTTRSCNPACVNGVCVPSSLCGPANVTDYFVYQNDSKCVVDPAYVHPSEVVAPDTSADDEAKAKAEANTLAAESRTASVAMVGLYTSGGSSNFVRYAQAVDASAPSSLSGLSADTLSLSYSDMVRWLEPVLYGIVPLFVTGSAAVLAAVSSGATSTWYGTIINYASFVGLLYLIVYATFFALVNSVDAIGSVLSLMAASGRLALPDESDDSTKPFTAAIKSAAQLITAGFFFVAAGSVILCAACALVMQALLSSASTLTKGGGNSGSSAGNTNNSQKSYSSSTSQYDVPMGHME